MLSHLFHEIELFGHLNISLPRFLAFAREL
jgi:hypothetical protein